MNNDVVNVNLMLAFKFKESDGKVSFIGKLIRWWTKSIYYHVELIWESEDDRFWISSNPDTGGVTIHNLKPLNDNWGYCKLPTVTLTKEQYHKVMNFMKDQKDCKYDVAGIIFSQVLPFRWDSKNKWFCSEITSTILKMVMVNEFIDVDPNMLSPADMARKLNFNKTKV